MKTLVRRGFVVTLLLLAGTAPTYAQETMRVRGTIERVEGQTFIVKTRSGDSIKLATTDKPLLVAVVKASLADRCAAPARATGLGTARKAAP